jgi:hypothetical protein
MSNFVIHLAAEIAGEPDSLLSRTRAKARAGATVLRIIDNSNLLAKLAAKKTRASSGARASVGFG